MGFINFAIEAFELFVRGFTGAGVGYIFAFAIFTFLILVALFLIYFALLKKGIKSFLIFWGIILAANIFLAVSGARESHCSSFECIGSALGSAVVKGFAMILFWWEFVPPVTFLLFKIFKPSSFLKTLIISLVSSFVIIGGLWGMVLITESVDEKVVDEVEESSVSAPIIKGIEEEAVGEEAEVVAEGEEQATEPEVKKLTQTEEIALIEKYYGLLEDGELEDAYAMKFEPKESFSKFKSWYGNVTSANPHDFTKTGDSRYQFTVELNEERGVEGKYQVVMEIIEGKLLKTVSSKEVSSSSPNLEEKIYNSELKAYVKFMDGNKHELYVSRSGVEVLIEALALKGDSYSIEGLEFSQSGRYLMYRILSGYENLVLHVYDTIELDEVYSVFAPSEHGFTNDEQYFYACQGTGMMAGYIEIFNAPSFTFKEDLTPGSGSGLMVGGCSYDAGSNLLKYTLFGNGSYDLIEHVYAF